MSDPTKGSKSRLAGAVNEANCVVNNIPKVQSDPYLTVVRFQPEISFEVYDWFWLRVIFSQWETWSERWKWERRGMI